ncbi:MAG TPA: hypothetical protein VGC87_14495 [Pyrinomonadaceae bacterium]|jgi:hypothetical protein
MAINWMDDIAPLFTQYDVIQMKWKFDLSDYNTVKTYAQSILYAVSPNHPNTTSRMPLYEDPWTPEMIDTFQQWMTAGYPYSATSADPPTPPAPDPLVPVFIALSNFLTGFDDLDQNPGLAQTYLTRLRNETAYGAALDALLAELEPNVSNPQALGQQVLGSTAFFVPPVPPATEAQLTDLAQRIVILWYTATIATVPTDPAEQPVYVFGTPQDNQYVSALMWPAAQAHPMGYSTEDFGYWDKPPSGMQWTGLQFYFKP